MISSIRRARILTKLAQGGLGAMAGTAVASGVRGVKPTMAAAGVGARTAPAPATPAPTPAPAPVAKPAGNLAASMGSARGTGATSGASLLNAKGVGAPPGGVNIGRMALKSGLAALSK